MTDGALSAPLISRLKQRLRELSRVEGLQLGRLYRRSSPIHLPPVADGHNDDP